MLPWRWWGLIAPGRLLLLLPLGLLQAQDFHLYLGDVDQRSAIIAWGSTNGSGNIIGRDSVSHGKAVIRLGTRRLSSDRNWIRIDDLSPDRDYTYQVSVPGKPPLEGAFRTWPASADKLTFMVIGDYGDGRSGQYAVADAMRRGLARRSQTDNPVRFILTTGDNIYGHGFPFFLQGTGNKDKHWETRFFRPYRDILPRVPFFPTLGNHDGNESESRRDLPVYLDNFFFPGGVAARYYRFSFAGLADFFALDSTENDMEGYPRSGYGPLSEQTLWLESALKSSRAKWKIVYFHHPPFSAGPRHAPSLDKLRHWVDLFRQYGVHVVFNGHEHNFQIAEKTPVTGNVQYLVTGSGGQLREGDVSKTAKARGISGWSAQRHFLMVEINGDQMRIMPTGPETVKVVSPDGGEIPMPLVIQAGAKPNPK
jgi:tartrate-resistant acid phosphatase type 5